MNELFEGSGEDKFPEGEAPCNELSLDDRRNQLEDKINQEMNAVSLEKPECNNTKGNNEAQNNSFVPHCCDNSGQKGSSQSVNTMPVQGCTPNTPYSSYNGPYGYTGDYTNGLPYYGAAPKKPMGKGLKVFLGAVIGLCAVFVVAFVVDCVYTYGETGGFDLDSFIESYNYDYDYGYDDDSDYYSSTDDDWNDSDEEQSSSDNSDNGEIKGAPDPTTIINENAGVLKVVDQPEDIDSAEYTARNAYKKVENSVVGVVTYYGNVGIAEESVGEGTGIIISSDGYIVTNSHVISDTKDIGVEIIMTDGTSYVAAIVGYDTRTDLAVLKIDEENLTPVEFVNSEQIDVGQDALAIGNPGGMEYSNSLTRGAVSALNRTVSSNSMVSYIQTDAAINPGNSGGPLLNIAGQVMGINTIKIVDTEYEGMGFAIPSNIVVEIANDLITQGYVSGRVRIGISGQEVSSYIASIYEVPQGIRIESFASDSPFNGTEAKEDDIITEINGQTVTGFTELYSELEKYEPGDKVTITLFRANQSSSGGKTLEVEITLLEDKGETQAVN